MAIKQKQLKITRLIQVFCIFSFVFISQPSYAAYYGGHHHYRPYYGYHSYPYHRPYYNYHRGYHGHYGVGAHVRGDAAYVVLGVLGVALLAHIFTNNKSESKESYPKSYPHKPPVKVVTQKPVKYQKPKNRTYYRYSENQGWEMLAKGNADTALDIFAVQSQQTLNSGKPKVGFAIAAATVGANDRAIRAMRKAVRIDVNALNNIDIHPIKHTIKELSANYQAKLNNNINDKNTAFMMATLFYLEQDYDKAKALIAKNDQSQSANNLRALLKNNNI